LFPSGFDDPLLLPLAPYLLELGLSEGAVKRLHARNPNVLHLREAPRDIVSWLGGVVGEKGVNKVITRHPWLLGLSLEKNLNPTVSYLSNELEIAERGLKGVVERHTGVLGLGSKHLVGSVEVGASSEATITRWLVVALGLPKP